MSAYNPPPPHPHPPTPPPQKRLPFFNQLSRQGQDSLSRRKWNEGWKRCAMDQGTLPALGSILHMGGALN